GNGSSRYQLDLIANGHVQLQRVVSGTTTVLVDVASGLSDLGEPATLTLSASGAAPVLMTGSVNGKVILSATDSSSSAISTSGYAGMYTLNAGVVFDIFVLSGSSAAPAPDAGAIVDAGSVVDAGASRDAGSIQDAGSIVDAGSPRDAGSPTDAGPSDAGNPSGPLFT